MRGTERRGFSVPLAHPAVAVAGRRPETVGMSESIQRRREHRRAFLRLLYEEADGSVSEFVSAFDIGATLGIDDTESRKIFEYLEEKGYVMVDDHRAGIVRITAAGVDEVESDA
jgi:hypothetical protein